MPEQDQSLSYAMQRHQAGDLAAAETVYRQTLERQPEHPQALHLMGILHGQRQEHAAAVPYFERALVQNPEWPEAHNNLGASLTRLGRYDEAVRHFQTALKLRPAYANALENWRKALQNQASNSNRPPQIVREREFVKAALALANLLLEQQQHTAAMTALEYAAAFAPKDLDVLYTSGCVRLARQEYDAAAALFRQVLAAGSHPHSHHNLAICLQALGQFDEALEHSNQALAADPAKFEYRFTRALTWLTQGDLLQGWPAYECRFEAPDAQPRHFSKPCWNGAPLDGKTLFIHTEQGFGDTFQFVRYLPLIKKLGGRVLFEYQDGLGSLIAGCSGYDTALSESEASVSPLIAEEQFDCHIPLLSLPAAFGTTLETIPAEIPYIAASAEKTAEWRQKLAQLAGEKPFKVGIVWAGNPHQKNNHNRSCSLQDFSPLAGIPGVTFFSLQKGEGAEQTAAPPPDMRLINLAPELQDFADTAAVIENLDLVITVCTSVAHLAGAMGKPVWTMLCSNPDFRWLHGRTDTPWYPSMRLFRQCKPRDWNAVFEQIGQALAETLQDRADDSVKSPEVSAQITQALTWHERGDWAQAETAYRAVLQDAPENPQALYLLGSLLSQRGSQEEAVTFISRALASDNGNAQAHNNLGIALKKLRKYEEAAEEFRAALRLLPDFPEAYNNLGNCLQAQDSIETAIQNYHHALRLKPDYADAHNNLGICFQTLDRLEEALRSHEEALRHNPRCSECWNNIGNCLQAMQQDEKALLAYEQAIALQPDHASAHLNRSIIWLRQGDFHRGWAEYEWRTRFEEFPKRAQDAPLWLGAPIQGKTLLIFAEQGTGDTFQFFRYLQIVRDQGVRIVFECQHGLRSLLQECAGYDEIVERPISGEPAAINGHDLQAALMSLPGILGTSLDSIPAETPYLFADKNRSQIWAERIEKTPHLKGFKVGVVWAGSATHKNDRNRSCRLSDLAPLADIPGVSFFSLQKGPAAKEAAEAPFPLINLSSALEDYSDTAAVIDCLDLVISVDTSVAHLAGAMGKPVWTLLPFAPDWRWMLERDDTPWYPSMRLFRQEQPKEWKSVLEKVAVNLCNEIGVRAWETGDVQAALTAFLQALQRNPENRDTVLNCADVFKAFGQFENASILYRSYLSRRADAEIEELLGAIEHLQPPLAA